MKFSTFYFSGTGNTKWAVKEFNQIIMRKGHDVRMFSIDVHDNLTDEQLRKIINDSDCIGFANPIYGGDIPPIMRAFINRLVGDISDFKTEKKTYVINTFGYINAFGPNEMEKLLVGSSLVLRAYVNIRLCNNVTNTKPGAKTLNRKTLDKRMIQGKRELNQLANCLISEKKRIKGHGPQLMIGHMIRKKIPEAIARHYQTLGINTETCTRCLTCVNHCPAGSIRFVDDTFTFLSGCTACMRCYNFCPTGSITMDGVYADPREFPRFQGPDV